MAWFPRIKRKPPKVYRYIYGLNAESCWKANKKHRHTVRAILFTMSLNKPSFKQFKSYVYDNLHELLASIIRTHGCIQQQPTTEVEEDGEEVAWMETRGIGSYIIHYRGDEFLIAKDIIRLRPFWKR